MKLQQYLQQYKAKAICKKCICGADGRPVAGQLARHIRFHRDQIVPTVEYVYEIQPEQPYPPARD